MSKTKEFSKIKYPFRLTKYYAYDFDDPDRIIIPVVFIQKGGEIHTAYLQEGENGCYDVSLHFDSNCSWIISKKRLKSCNIDKLVNKKTIESLSFLFERSCDLVNNIVHNKKIKTLNG